MFHLKILSVWYYWSNFFCLLNFKKDIGALEMTDAFNLTLFCDVMRRGFGGRFGFCHHGILLGNGDLIPSSHMQNLRKLGVFA
jgi:hypothetical protein